MAKRKVYRKKVAAVPEKTPASKMVGKASAGAASQKAGIGIGSVLDGWSRGIRILERWTVDRIDEEAGVVRLEKVRMPQRVLERVVKDKVAGGLFEKDDLELWKEGDERSEAMTRDGFLKRLGLKLMDKETLAENMVFLVLMSVKGKVLAVYHVTQAARELSRELYEAVVGA